MGSQCQGDEPGVTAATADDVRRQWANALSAQRRDPGRRRQHSIGSRSSVASNRCSATGSRSTPRDAAIGPPANGTPHIPFESNQCHIGIAFPTVPYRDPQYLQAWAAVGVLSTA